MWSLVTTRGQRVALRELPAVLGRTRDEAEVALPHASIEPRHARLELHAEGGLLITAIEGAHVELADGAVSEGRLVHGDTLVLGRVSLRVVDDRALEPLAAAEPTRTTPSASDLPDAEDGLTLRRPAPAVATGQAASRGSRTAPAAGRAAPRETLSKRRDEVLSFGKAPARRGLLNADLSQLSGPVRALLLLLLLALAVGVVWGLSSLVAA